MRIGEMKRILKEHDNHYFDKDSIRFWGSCIESPINKNGLFLESIDDFYKEKRLYKVNCFALEGVVWSLQLSEDEHFFNTKESAKKFMNMISIILSGCKQINKVTWNPWGYEFEDIDGVKKRYEYKV